MSERYAYILLSNVKFWNRLCDRHKAGNTSHAFVRKGAVGPKNTQMLLFYVSHPRKEIGGVAEFVERVTGLTGELWNMHGSETCLKSFEEYLEFMEGRDKATFIRFKNFREINPPIPLKTLCEVLGTRRLSRAGKYLSREDFNELIGGTMFERSF
jgi:predicted transcriptional regulator